jgi:hypothetical protein
LADPASNSVANARNDGLFGVDCLAAVAGFDIAAAKLELLRWLLAGPILRKINV